MQQSVARKSKYPVKFSSNVELGLLEWIDNLLEEEEDRSSFIRKALRREAERRDPRGTRRKIKDDVS